MGSLPETLGDLPGAVQADTASVPRRAPGSMRSQRVLVVDDDAMLRRVLRREIAKAGFDVVEAESGDVALGLLEGGLDVAVVFLDYRMPGKMGDVVLRELRDRFPSVAVIMCSGEMTAAHAKAFEDLGAAACLEKPVPREAILSALTSVVQAER